MNVTLNPTQPISKQQLGFGTKIEINTKTIKPDISHIEQYYIDTMKTYAEGDIFKNYTLKIKSPRDGMVVGQIIDPAGKTLKLADQFISSGSETLHSFGVDDLGTRVMNIYDKALPRIIEDASQLKK